MTCSDSGRGEYDDGVEKSVDVEEHVSDGEGGAAESVELAGDEGMNTTRHLAYILAQGGKEGINCHHPQKAA
jgi:hypothetical protein